METWSDVLNGLIALVIALCGVPITQLIKNGLTLLFKKQVEDRWALLVTGVVAAAFALLELVLTKALDFGALTPENFPAYFTAVFTVATIYYSAMKNSKSNLGKGFLLKKTVV